MEVYILCGLPGSGKSTWAMKQKGIIINRDSLRTMIHGKYKYDADLEPLIKDMAKELLCVALNAGHNVIIDETNLTKAKRKFWTNIINNSAATYCVWFTETYNNLENRMTDSRGISREKWSEVIEVMKKSFEKPDIYEGFVVREIAI